LKYRIVTLGKDFEGKITNFAEARNSFLAQNEWVLFIDDDEEPSRMLLDYLDQLEPRYPYYWIRRLNLLNGKYRALWNPEYSARLVSSKVRYFGEIHERVVPKEPHGTIDFPIVHNHVGRSTYQNYWYQNLPTYRVWLGLKKMMEVIRDR
jgi:hypothetical protein